MIRRGRKSNEVAVGSSWRLYRPYVSGGKLFLSQILWRCYWTLSLWRGTNCIHKTSHLTKMTSQQGTKSQLWDRFCFSCSWSIGIVSTKIMINNSIIYYIKCFSMNQVREHLQDYLDRSYRVLVGSQAGAADQNLYLLIIQCFEVYVWSPNFDLPL